jgi:hypothetical protein
MKLLTGLFRMARKRTQTTDNDMGMFREKLTELVEKKAELPDEEVAKRVDELKEMTVDLPDEEGKAKLDRFLEDFKSVKEQDDATAKEAASMVSDLFEKLDTEAMKDVPDAGGEEATEEATEEVAAEEEAPLVESEAAPEADAEATEAVEETVAEEEAKDADPNPEYTLEEIYQFCKRRREEDEAAAAEDAACAEDSAEEVEEEKEEDEEEEVVTDHAPRIPVTMNGTPAAKGSLADMFNTLKEGGR